MSNADRCACGHKIVAHGASFAHRGTGACLVGLCQCKVPVEAPQAAPLFDTSAAPNLHSGFELCAAVDCPDASIMSIRHAHGHGGRTQVLRDPPAQPAPSGDEAKVRDDIAERWIAHPDPPMGGLIGRVYGAVREAYAAGKATERKTGERLIRARADVAFVITDLAAPRVRKALHEIADAIARRGSEGK